MWRAWLDQPAREIAGLRRLLSNHEVQRAGRFVLESDRTRFIAAHGILRLILSRYTAEEPDRLSFTAPDTGKPYLAYQQDHGLMFNLSHSANVVLVAITRGREVGVDVERVREIPEAIAIAQRMFPSATRELYAAAEPERERLFFRFWTRYEARLKASGAGLAGADRTPGLESSEGSDLAEGMRAWAIEDVHPYPGYVGAVAVPAGQHNRIDYLDWAPI